MNFAGQIVGLVLAGALGGVAIAVLGAPNLAILGAIAGLVLAYPVVRWLMKYEGARPALKWLYPYEGWTGGE